MKAKIHGVFKWVWLAIFIFSTLYFILVSILDHWKKAQVFLIIIPVSLAFYFYRRSQQKKEESNEKKLNN